MFSPKCRWELAGRARDGEGEGGLGERGEVGQLPRGQCRIGGGDDGADGHERQVEHGDVEDEGHGIHGGG